MLFSRIKHCPSFPEIILAGNFNKKITPLLVFIATILHIITIIEVEQYSIKGTEIEYG